MAFAYWGTANVEAARPSRKSWPGGSEGCNPKRPVTSGLLDQGDLDAALHDPFHGLANLVDQLVVGSGDHLVVFDRAGCGVLENTARKLDIPEELQSPRLQRRGRGVLEKIAEGQRVN